jgi:hypothetical protein
MPIAADDECRDGDREASDGGHDFVCAIDEGENEARDGENDRRGEQALGNKGDCLLQRFPNRAEHWILLLLIEGDDLRTLLDRPVSKNDAQFDALYGDVVRRVGDGVTRVRRKVAGLSARLQIAALRLTNAPF